MDLYGNELTFFSEKRLNLVLALHIVSDGSVDLELLDEVVRAGMLLFPERLAPEEIKYSDVIGNSVYQEFQYRRGIPFFGWVLTFFDISAMFCSLPNPIPGREEMKA